jgi:hypothetical protein
MARLLQRPRPVVGEGPSAYLHRLRLLNRLSDEHVRKMRMSFSTAWLRKEGCLDAPGVAPDLDAYVDRLTELRRLMPEAWLKRTRLCPSCVVEGVAGLVEWEIRFCDVCVVHKTWLVDTCDACGCELRRGMLDVLRCSCGRRLGQQRVHECPPSCLRLSLAFKHCVMDGRVGDVLLPMQELVFVDLQRLVRFLGAFGTEANGPRPQKMIGCKSLDESWSISTIAAEALGSWPAGMQGLLTMLRQRSVTQHDDKLAESLGPGYTAAYRDLQGDQFRFVHDEVARHLSKSWRGQLCARNRRALEAVNDKEWVSMAEAVTFAGLSLRSLSKRLADWEVEVHRRSSQAGRIFQSVRRSDLEMLLRLPPIDSDWSDLRTLLGLGKRRCRNLALLGAFQGAQLSLWPDPSDPSSEWVTALRLVLQRACIEGPEASTVRLRDLLRAARITNRALVSILDALVGGSLIPSFVDPKDRTVAGLRFSPESLMRWLSSPEDWTGSDFSVPAAAVELGVKQEVAYHWVRVGLMQAKSCSARGSRNAALIERSALAKFRSLYVTARELATRTGRSPRSIGKLLLAAGIEAVSGPDVDGGRQLLFKRCADLEERLHGLCVHQVDFIDAGSGC